MAKPKKRNQQHSSKKAVAQNISPRFSPHLAAKILLGLGILFLVIPALFYINETIQLSRFSPDITTNRSTSSAPLPTQLSIPSVSLDLPITPTTIANGVWEIAPTGVSYLTTSKRPGEKGAIILYAHNTNEQFGPIRWLTLGAQIDVTTADKKKYTYKVVNTLEIPSTAIEIFDQKDETLILYTCSGFADLQRFIVIAKRRGEELQASF